MFLNAILCKLAAGSVLDAKVCIAFYSNCSDLFMHSTSDKEATNAIAAFERHDEGWFLRSSLPLSDAICRAIRQDRMGALEEAVGVLGLKE